MHVVYNAHFTLAWLKQDFDQLKRHLAWRQGHDGLTRVEFQRANCNAAMHSIQRDTGGSMQGSFHHAISLTSFRIPFTTATVARCHRRHSIKPPHAVARTDRIGADVEALTPHSGYHYDGRRGRFFEGWYFRVSSAYLSTQ